MWAGCLNCGVTFYGSGRFCTSKCEEAFLRPPLHKPVTNKCHWCGKPSEKLFCSDKCKKLNSENGNFKRVCEVCGRGFMGGYIAKYCSDKCRRASIARRWENKRLADKCIQCGGPMPADYVGACSKECQIAFNGREEEMVYNSASEK